LKRAWYILAAAFWLGALAPDAHALLLSLEATWGASGSVVEGSIVQVVVVQTGQNAPTDNAPGHHFQPYGGSYLPDTVVASGNELIYTGSVVQQGDSYYFFAAVEVPNIYDRVYLRVFYEDHWEQGTAIESAWGVSEVHEITDDGAGMGFTWWDDIPLPNTNAFEVIPEPGTVALLGMGAVALAGWSRRKRESKGMHGGKTGGDEP